MADEAQMVEEVRPVLEHYSLGLAEVARLKKGHNNRHFTVDADGKRYVLRCYTPCGESG
jgi:hypothetical protein